MYSVVALVINGILMRLFVIGYSENSKFEYSQMCSILLALSTTSHWHTVIYSGKMQGGEYFVGEMNRVTALAQAKTNSGLSDCDSRIVKVKFSEIPFFLRDGEFYKSLSAENECDGEVEVPHRCFHQTAAVYDVHDFERMIQVVAFWGLKSIPQSLIRFCADKPTLSWANIIDQMGSELTFAHELRDIFRSPRVNALSNAIKWGKTEIVEFLAEHETRTERGSIEAAICGRADYLVLLHHYEHPWDKKACAAAAAGGHLDCLQHLHESGCPWDYQVFINAAKCGSLPCIEYAYTNGLTWHVDAGIALAKMKLFDTLIYAIQHGCPLHSDMTKYAAYEGHRECLQYLLHLNCPAVDAMHFACQEGRINSLQLLHEHGVPWDKNVAIAAIQNNQFECLQYLHENGCPWDSEVSTEAAESGQIEFLRYCLENNCPYSDRIIIHAAVSRTGSALDCVRYLTEEQGVYMSEQGEVFAAAFGSANVELVKYLLDIGCPYEDCFDTAPSRLKSSLFISTAYIPDNDDQFFAVDLLECVKLAVERRYNFSIDLMHLLCTEFPLCRKYLELEGYQDSSVNAFRSRDYLTNCNSLLEDNLFDNKPYRKSDPKEDFYSLLDY